MSILDAVVRDINLTIQNISNGNFAMNLQRAGNEALEQVFFKTNVVAVGTLLGCAVVSAPVVIAISVPILSGGYTFFRSFRRDILNRTEFLDKVVSNIKKSIENWSIGQPIQRIFVTEEGFRGTFLNDAVESYARHKVETLIKVGLVGVISLVACGILGTSSLVAVPLTLGVMAFTLEYYTRGEQIAAHAGREFVGFIRGNFNAATQSVGNVFSGIFR